ANGTQVLDPRNSGLTQWRAAGIGRNPDILPLAQLYGDVMWTQEKFGEVAFAEAHRRSRKLM
ncbi:unnamed protein product, partial [Ascophyllum nodosum]